MANAFDRSQPMLPARAKPTDHLDADFNSQRVISSLAAVAARLAPQHADAATADGVATIAAELVRFCDAALGRKGAGAPMVKLPAELFRDVRRDGALAAALEACLRFKAEHGWRQFELSSAPRAAPAAEMVLSAEAALVAQGFFVKPRVFFGAGCKDVRRLSQLAAAKGVQVVASADGATHILQPDPPGTTVAETQHEDFMRQTDRDMPTGMARVHWWYHPDSYDQWLPAADVEDELDDVGEGRPWFVQTRWLEDVAKFNEWMNESDYEVAQPLPPLPGAGEVAAAAAAAAAGAAAAAAAAAGGGKKRGGCGGAAAAAGGGKEEQLVLTIRRGRRGASKSGQSAPESDDDVDVLGERPPKARRRNPAAKPAVAVENLLAPVESRPGEMPADEQLERMMQQSSGEVSGYGVEHRLQLCDVDAVPASADNSKYTRSVPAEWYDAGAVHETEQLALPEFFSGAQLGRTPRAYRAIRDALVDAYGRAPYEPLTLSACRALIAGDVANILRVHAFLEHWSLINHSVRETDLDLGQQLSPAEVFTFSEVSAPAVMPPPAPRLQPQQALPYERNANHEWSEGECGLLLDAIGKYQDNWDAVARYVNAGSGGGSGPQRTPADCLKRFLKLPIEDPAFDSFSDPGAPMAQRGVPFATAPDPLAEIIRAVASFFEGSPAHAHELVRAVAAGAMEEEARQQQQQQQQQGKGMGNGGGGREVQPAEAHRRRTAAAVAGLKLAASRSQALAEHEEASIRRLVTQAIGLQCQKIRMRTRELETLDANLAKKNENLTEQLPTAKADANAAETEHEAVKVALAAKREEAASKAKATEAKAAGKKKLKK